MRNYTGKEQKGGTTTRKNWYTTKKQKDGVTTGKEKKTSQSFGIT